ncbi:unnamed protein product [Sphagnum tenellum]
MLAWSSICYWRVLLAQYGVRWRRVAYTGVGCRRTSLARRDQGCRSVQDFCRLRPLLLLKSSNSVRRRRRKSPRD